MKKIICVVIIFIVTAFAIIVLLNEMNKKDDASIIDLPKVEKQISDFFIENREQFETIYKYLLVNEGSFNISGEFKREERKEKYIDGVSDCVKNINSLLENERFDWLNDLNIGTVKRNKNNYIEFTFTMIDNGQIFVFNKNNTVFSDNLSVIVDDWCLTCLYPT